MRIYVAIWYDTVLWVGTDEREARAAADDGNYVAIWENGEEIGCL